MLDDLKYIHQRDGQDALGIAERQWQQLTYEFRIQNSEFRNDVENIVYAGMGGSALAALISKSWPGYKIPFEVSRQYKIPQYVDERSLFIAASYSGNTEESLSALEEAESKRAQIVIIAGGGELEKRAQEKSYPFLRLPKVEQPRYGVLYNLKAIVTVLDNTQTLGEEQAIDKMRQAASFLRQAVTSWVATVPTASNPAKRLAMEIAGKSPVVYAGPLLSSVAYKWKINFNENAKNIAWWNELPEFDHNEFAGWASHPIDKLYEVIDLRSNLEHPRVQKRFEVGDQLLSGKRPAPHVVVVEGQTLLEQLIWAMAYGDFVSIYLALLNGVNPAPVELVEKLKLELNK